MTPGRGTSLRGTTCRAGGRRSLQVVRAAVGPAAALLVSACAWLGQTLGSSGGGVSSQYERALALLEDESFVAAEVMLRRMATSCDNGYEGRRSLLLLAAVWLDPRNRAANADSAAVLAARYLGLPDTDPIERIAAEGLYVLALDLGADPQLRPARVNASHLLALRFSNCEAPLPETVVSLPELGRESMTARLRSLERQRDSLAARASTLAEGSRTMERRVQELTTELQNAQAEIQRIRRLLGGRDTTSSEPPKLH